MGQTQSWTGRWGFVVVGIGALCMSLTACTDTPGVRFEADEGRTGDGAPADRAVGDAALGDAARDRDGDAPRRDAGPRLDAGRPDADPQTPPDAAPADAHVQDMEPQAPADAAAVDARAPDAAPADAARADAAPADVGVERCNGLDDDGDGATDEGFLGLGEACAEGQGACRADGVQVCDGDGLGVACGAIPVAPGEERCNDLDDDCDGAVDEGFDLARDSDNCGACGRVCEAVRVDSTACVASDCRPVCQARWLNLSGDTAEGCPCAAPAPDGVLVQTAGQSQLRLNQGVNTLYRGDGSPGQVAWIDDAGDGLRLWREVISTDGFSAGWPSPWGDAVQPIDEFAISMDAIPTGGYRVGPWALDEQGQLLADVEVRDQAPYAWDAVHRRFVGTMVTNDNHLLALGERRTGWANGVPSGAQVFGGACPAASGRCYFLFKRNNQPNEVSVVSFASDGGAASNEVALVSENLRFMKLVGLANGEARVFLRRLGDLDQMFEVRVDAGGRPQGPPTPVPIAPTEHIVRRADEFLVFHDNEVRPGVELPEVTWLDLEYEPTGRSLQLGYYCRPVGFAADDVIYCREGELVSLVSGQLIAVPSGPLDGNSRPVIASSDGNQTCWGWMGSRGGAWIGAPGGRPLHLAVSDPRPQSLAGVALPDGAAGIIVARSNLVQATLFGPDCSERRAVSHEVAWEDGGPIGAALQLKVAAVLADQDHLLAAYVGPDGERRAVGASIVSLDGSPLQAAPMMPRDQAEDESAPAIAGSGGEHGWWLLTRLRGPVPTIRMRHLRRVPDEAGDLIAMSRDQVFELPNAHVFGESLLALNHPRTHTSLVAWLDHEAPDPCDGIPGGSQIWTQVRDERFEPLGQSQRIGFDSAVLGCPRNIHGVALPEGFMLSWGVEVPDRNPRWGMWAQTFTAQGVPVGEPFAVPAGAAYDGIHAASEVGGRAQIAWLERSNDDRREEALLKTTTLSCQP